MKELFSKSVILEKTISKLVAFYMNLLSMEIIDADNACQESHRWFGAIYLIQIPRVGIRLWVSFSLERCCL